jgi:hypothetical protein
MPLAGLHQPFRHLSIPLGSPVSLAPFDRRKKSVDRDFDGDGVGPAFCTDRLPYPSAEGASRLSRHTPVPVHEVWGERPSCYHRRQLRGAILGISA